MVVVVLSSDDGVVSFYLTEVYILPVFTVIVCAFGAIPEKSNNKRPLLWQNYIFFKVYILS